MSRIAIFGGTFNPIHKGHINLCLQMNEIYQFKKIILIPTNIPPHKDVSDLASNEQRLYMCKLAVKDKPLFEVSDIEMRLLGVSYTINTICELKKKYKDDELFLIIGSDMLFMFHKWYRYEELLKNVTVIVGARQENEYQKMKDYVKTNLFGNKNINIKKINIFNISSTQIRNKIKIGQYTDLIEKDIYEYIVNNKIYIS